MYYHYSRADISWTQVTFLGPPPSISSPLLSPPHPFPNPLPIFPACSFTPPFCDPTAQGADHWAAPSETPPHLCVLLLPSTCPGPSFLLQHLVPFLLLLAGRTGHYYKGGHRGGCVQPAALLGTGHGRDLGETGGVRVNVGSGVGQ